MRFVSLPIALLSAAVAACSSIAPSSDDHVARCENTRQALVDCIGIAANDLDCSTLAEADVRRIQDAIDTVSCAAIARGVTVDGDPKSAACRLYGAGCVRALTPAAERRPTRYPILLVNGIDTSPLFRWSDRIVTMLRDEGGHEVELATLPPYQGPRVRAPELWKRINEVRVQTGATKVNLICHSLGGLDCRYLASPDGLHWDLDLPAEEVARAVASITTVGTAHRGTRAADVLLGLTPDGDRTHLIDAFITLSGNALGATAIDHDANVRDALTALSTSEAKRFADEIGDAEGVFYQSWAGYSRPFGAATAEHDARVLDECVADEGAALDRVDHDYMALPIAPFTDIVGNATSSTGTGTAPSASVASEPNDGFVTITSAKWGTFRGCIPADHMEQLGQRNLPDANVRTGFDVARFYAGVAADLAARGY